MAFTYKNNNVNILKYKGDNVNILQYQGTEVWRRLYTVSLSGDNCTWTYNGQTATSIQVPYGSTISKSNTVGEFVVTIAPANTTKILKAATTFPAGTAYVTNWDSIETLTIYTDDEFEFYYSDGYALELRNTLGYSYLSSELDGYKVLPGDSIGISGNTIVVTRNGGALQSGTVNTLANTTATSTNTTGYTYGVNVTSTSRVVNSSVDAVIEATDTRTDNSYWLAVDSFNPAYTTLSTTGLSVQANAELTVNNNAVTVDGTTITATPADDTDATATNTTGYLYRFNNWDIDGNIIDTSIRVTASTTIKALVLRTTRYWVAFNVNNSNYGTVDKSGFAASVGAKIEISDNTVSIGTTNVGVATFTKATDIACTATTTTGYSYSFIDITKSENITSVSKPITFTGNFSRTAYYWVSVKNMVSSYGSNTTGEGSYVEGTSITINDNVITIGANSYTATATTDTTCSATNTTAYTNCAFNCWADDFQSVNGHAITATTVTEPLTIYGYFTGNTYYWLSFSSNGSYGSVTPAGVAILRGDSIRTVTNSGASSNTGVSVVDITNSNKILCTASIGSTPDAYGTATNRISGSIWYKDQAVTKYTHSISSWTNVSATAKQIWAPTTLTCNFSRSSSSGGTKSTIYGYKITVTKSGSKTLTYNSGSQSVSKTYKCTLAKTAGTMYKSDLTTTASTVTMDTSTNSLTCWGTTDCKVYIQAMFPSDGYDNSGNTMYCSGSITCSTSARSTSKALNTTSGLLTVTTAITDGITFAVAIGYSPSLLQEASGASASGSIGSSGSLTASWPRTLCRTLGYATIQVYYRGKGGNSFTSNNGSGIASGTTKVSYSGTSYMTVSGISWSTSGITVSGSKGTAISYSWSLSSGAAYTQRC